MKACIGLYLSLAFLCFVCHGQLSGLPKNSNSTLFSLENLSDVEKWGNITFSAHEQAEIYELYQDRDRLKELFFKGPVCDEFYATGRNFTEDMETYKNCKFIHGDIIFSMAETPNEFDPSIMKNISWPSIRQISGFLLVYATYGITSLKDLFPNLTVINGMSLYEGEYSVVIMGNRDLAELGLPKLTEIRNGRIRIQDNHALCYLSTINFENWGKDVKSKNDRLMMSYNKNEGCVDSCLLSCKSGFCLGRDHCQESTCPDECPDSCTSNKTCECHKECSGGCLAPNDPNQCVACKNYVNINATCVSECAPHEYFSKDDGICLDLERCLNTYGWRIEPDQDDQGRRECVRHCPAGYSSVNEVQKVCQKCANGHCPMTCSPRMTEIRISNELDAKQYKGCEVMTSRLVFTLPYVDEIIMDKLEEYFGNLQEVASLQIERTALDSLKFLKSLKKITGDGGMQIQSDDKHRQKYSLYIRDNKKLDDLWFDPHKNNTLEIEGRVFVHFNPYLCDNYINYLREASTAEEDDRDISESSNAGSCMVINVNIRAEVPKMYFKPGEAPVHFEWEKPMVPEHHNHGYYLYYKIATHKNMTRLRRNQEAGCGDQGWEVKLIANTRKTGYLMYLLPYTQYAYYIKVKTSREIREHVESTIQYFNTSASLPLPPTLYTSMANNYTSLRIKWVKPSRFSGPFSHYSLLIKRKCEDVSLLNTFKGCAKGSERKQAVAETPTDPLDEKLSHSFTYCTPFGEGTGRSPHRGIQGATPKEQKILDERDEMTSFEYTIVDYIHTDASKNDEDFLFNPNYKNSLDNSTDSEGDVLPENGLNFAPTSRPRRSTINQTTVGTTTTSEPTKSTASSWEESMANYLKSKTSNFFLDYNIEEQREEFGSTISYVENKEIPIQPACHYSNEKCEDVQFERRYNDTTEVVINNLCHYTNYEILLGVCITDPYAPNVTYCTEVRKRSVIDQRTLPDVQNKVDKVTNISSIVNGTKQLQIFFNPPLTPNGMIKYYQIIYNTKGSDITTERCCSAWEFNEYGMCTLQISEPGSYEFRIQPVSLAGLIPTPEFSQSEAYPFIITNNTPQKHLLEALILCISGIFGIVTLGIVIYVKRSNADNNKRSTYLMTVNPEYSSVGTYLPDAYEIAYDKVKPMRKIGNGHFGEVYEGIAKEIVAGDDETKVAIKTLLNNENPLKRQEFLKEASTMKAFNSYHVVRLLGVVSLSENPMVIMEYMGNGDLKSFLRSSRPDAEGKRIDPLTVSQKLQMCCEIADGMAYLVDCKFVHRDLAARNCLVHEDLTVKIGDFGLTRDVYETDYYRIDSKGVMPVRWMAPESLKDGVFNSRSDIWSYGIVLWEIATLAEQPYQGRTHDEVTRFVIDGGYMQRPKSGIGEEGLYDIMLGCWSYSPKTRPTFEEIVTIISKYHDVTDNFRDNAYCFKTKEVKIQDDYNQQQQQQQAPPPVAITNSLPVDKDPLLFSTSLFDSIPNFLNGGRHHNLYQDVAVPADDADKNNDELERLRDIEQMHDDNWHQQQQHPEDERHPLHPRFHHDNQQHELGYERVATHNPYDPAHFSEPNQTSNF